jgi:hypothetical protein
MEFSKVCHIKSVNFLFIFAYTFNKILSFVFVKSAINTYNKLNSNEL